MKKAMFHKFTNFIQQAVDTFSPNVSPQEEFVYHWKSITSYFVDNRGGGVRIEETALPEHLMSMLRIMQEEESDLSEAGTTGICLEYLLQHRLLETLYTLGRTDHPPGMKQIVLSFFTKLLSRISHPLLPHINVHRAVQRLVKACGETKAGPTEKEEIEFLCTVCAKIKTDPYLVNFFIESPKQAIPKGTARNPQQPFQAFSLVVALLSLSSSEDARVSVKACEGLMLCASLPEKSAAIAIITHTQFCQTIANTLLQLYQKLPTLVSPENVENLEAKWGFDDIIERNENQTFVGRRQVISFLSWLDYCDQLIALANPHVGEAVALEIHKVFLTGQLLPSLLQPSECGSIVATTYTTRCLRTVCSPALLREFCYFLLGNERTFEVKNNPEHPLKKRLLERCNHLSEEVCIATLKLFDRLLQKEDEHIIHSLLLRNLLGRSYLQGSPQLSQDNSSATPTADNVSKEVTNIQDHEKSVVVSENLHNHTDRSQAASISHRISEDSQTVISSQSEDSPTVVSSQSEDSQTVVSSQNEPSESHSEITNTEQQPSPLTEDKATISPETSSFAETEPSVDPNQTKDSENGRLPGKGISSASSTVPANQVVDDSCNLDSQSSDSTPNHSSSSSESFSLPSGFASPVFVRSEVHKVVNSFLSLVPEEVKSSYQTSDSGYDMYLRDAHQQFAIQETVCKDWAWPKEPVVLAEYVMDIFYEGSFLRMLFDKLLRLLDQSYSVNLLLTALIAKVALIPHPNLHEFLLDPFLPTADGTQTLYSALVKVTNEIKQHQKCDSTFCQKLLMARKQLLGMVPTIHSLRINHIKLDMPWFEDQSRMEAIIVLEEFCKELSAITFVKHHAAVTRF